ncbi:unnamed protein product [Rhizophagus irregularis]|nr:unnamed protein product [Rhizophagus irregularis]
MEEITQNTVEFESLLAYDSSEDFSDTESTFEDICSEMEDTRENEEDNSLELYVGKTFQNWEHVENFMKKYAATKGHGVRIGGGGKVDKMTNEVMKRRMSMEKEILEEIQFLTVFAKVNATVQYRIIREKFKIRIHRPDLYNAIRSFRREATPGEEDTGLLLKRLYDKKTEDPRWVILMKVDPVTSSLTHLFWMSPEQQILWLRYHDVILHDNTCKTNRYNRPLSLFVTPDNNLKTRIVAQAIVDDETQLSYEWVYQCVKEATDFYTARNSLKEDQFNERWNTLLQNYPQSKDYLTKVLGCNPQSWARSFTNKYFTAGVQTTSRNEGKNSTLKRLFGNSNLSLCELFDALEERYQEENDYCEFVNWKQTVPQIGSQNIPKSIFGSVVKQLNEFLMPNIIKKQEEQMNLSLCYHATEIEFENARSKENIIDESNRCIDNLFDFPQVHLSSFLEDTLTILEVWEIVYLANSKTSHFVYLLNDNTFLVHV